MTGASYSHPHKRAFSWGLGGLLTLALIVSGALIAGPVAAQPTTQAATATVVPGGATGALTTTLTTTPASVASTLTVAPAITTTVIAAPAISATAAGTPAISATVTVVPSGATVVLTTTLTSAPTSERSTPNSEATRAASASDVLPAGVGTNVPKPMATGGAAAVPTGGAAGIVPQAGAGQPNVAPTTAPSNNGSGLGSLLPWLVGALVLAGLAGMAFFALRPKTAVVPVAAPVATTAVAPTVGMATEPATTQLGAPAIRCPNCDTLNPPDRRFCDECGQDLRPSGAGTPTTTLPPVNEATIPYLETLSRVDEQLEFVLARNTVTLGRAGDNDVVIDDRFIGWQTVSPHHARLTRQGDGFVIADLQSDNGTFVNSARTGQNVLEDGMTVTLGKVEFVYRVPPA